MATDAVVFWFRKHGGKQRFPEWAWIPFTWIPSQCPHFAVKSSTYPSGFGRIIYCLARGNRQYVVKTPQPHSWMPWLCEWTHAYIRVNCEILTGGNQDIWMVSCVFTSVVFCWKYSGKVSWMTVNAVYLNSVAMFTFRRWKSIDENGLKDGVTKAQNVLALHYKQITAWFLRDIWHKYWLWFFKINITRGLYAKYPLKPC